MSELTFPHDSHLSIPGKWRVSCPGQSGRKDDHKTEEESGIRDGQRNQAHTYLYPPDSQRAEGHVGLPKGTEWGFMHFTQSSRTQEPSDSIWVIQSCPVYRQQVLHTTKRLPAPSLLVLSTVCGKHMFSRVATGIKKPSLLRTAYTNSQTDHFSFFFSLQIF